MDECSGVVSLGSFSSSAWLPRNRGGESRRGVGGDPACGVSMWGKKLGVLTRSEEGRARHPLCLQLSLGGGLSGCSFTFRNQIVRGGWEACEL